ncbi:MAG: hypothetical protein AAFO94_17180 [Bacteroidota bacterium]
MLRSKVILLLFAIAFLSTTACKKETVSTCGANWVLANEVSDEINALSVAVNDYAQDQSTANCNAYVAALNDYIDAVEALEDCARSVGQLQEFNEAIEDARDDLNSFQC